MSADEEVEALAGAQASEGVKVFAQLEVSRASRDPAKARPRTLTRSHPLTHKSQAQRDRRMTVLAFVLVQ